MKNGAFILLLLVSRCFLFGQNLSGSSGFWNTVSIDNPAFSALNQRTELNLNYSHPTSPQVAGVIFNQKVKLINSGVGINYTYRQFSDATLKQTKFNYNYQWNLKDSSCIAFGGGMGLTSYRKSASKMQTTNITTLSADYNIAFLLGFAFTKRRFTAGAGYIKHALRSIEPESGSVNLYASYKQDINASISVISHVFYHSFFNSQHSLNFAFITELKQKFNFGIGTYFTVNPFLTAGYRANNGLSFNYTYVTSSENFEQTQWGTFQHELNMRLALPNR